MIQSCNKLKRALWLLHCKARATLIFCGNFQRPFKTSTRSSSCVHCSVMAFSSWVHRRRSASFPFPALLFAHQNCACPFSQGFPLLSCLSTTTPTPLSASRLSQTQTSSCWYLLTAVCGSREPSFPSKAEPSPPGGCTLLLLLYPFKQPMWCLHTSSPADLILRSDPSLKIPSPERTLFLNYQHTFTITFRPRVWRCRMGPIPLTLLSCFQELAVTLGIM